MRVGTTQPAEGRSAIERRRFGWKFGEDRGRIPAEGHRSGLVGRPVDLDPLGWRWPLDGDLAGGPGDRPAWQLGRRHRLHRRGGRGRARGGMHDDPLRGGRWNRSRRLARRQVVERRRVLVVHAKGDDDLLHRARRGLERRAGRRVEVLFSGLARSWPRAAPLHRTPLARQWRRLSACPARRSAWAGPRAWPAPPRAMGPARASPPARHHVVRWPRPTWTRRERRPGPLSEQLGWCETRTRFGKNRLNRARLEPRAAAQNAVLRSGRRRGDPLPSPDHRVHDVVVEVDAHVDAERRGDARAEQEPGNLSMPT